MDDFMVFGLVTLVAVIGLMMSGATGYAMYGEGYFGPEYTQSDYGRRIYELRGPSDPMGVEAAQLCNSQTALDDRLACCQGACGQDNACGQTCTWLVERRPYQRIHPLEAR